MTAIENYISQFPDKTQEKLRLIHQIIKSVALEVEEDISYGMPAFKTNKKPHVYFAGYKNHIGFYATPTVHEAFAKELDNYKQGKGSVQFPLDAPLPVELIQRIVAFRVEENNKN